MDISVHACDFTIVSREDAIVAVGRGTKTGDGHKELGGNGKLASRSSSLSTPFVAWCGRSKANTALAPVNLRSRTRYITKATTHA